VSSDNAWLAADYAGRDDWIDRLSDAEIADLDAALVRLESRALHWPDFGLDDFELPVLGPRLARVLRELRSGRGFVVLRGIPVRRYTGQQLRSIYWGIGQHLGQVISQNAKGDLIGDVTDTGANYRDPSVRGYLTRADLRPHCDSADLVGLFCLRTAKSGGLSSIASSISIYNSILRERRQFLAPLYEGFQYDLRGEGITGRADEVTRNRVPVYSWYKGHLSCRFNPRTIESAPIRTGIPLTPLQADAVRYVERLALDPKFRLDMQLQEGDIQLLDNHSVLHSRTEYVDHDDPAEKRLLLRLWLHVRDGRELAANFAERYNTGQRGGVAVTRAPGTSI
jgi:hypothetical protein